jgi:hypothetical protein
MFCFSLFVFSTAVQTGSVVHTTSYTMDTWLFFLGDKAAAANHSRQSSAGVKNSRRNIYTSPHAFKA